MPIECRPSANTQANAPNPPAATKMMPDQSSGYRGRNAFSKMPLCLKYQRMRGSIARTKKGPEALKKDHGDRGARRYSLQGYRPADENQSVTFTKVRWRKDSPATFMDGGRPFSQGRSRFQTALRTARDSTTPATADHLARLRLPGSSHMNPAPPCQLDCLGLRLTHQMK